MPVTNIHRNEILEQLPAKYIVIAPAFEARQEAYGRDTRYDPTTSV